MTAKTTPVDLAHLARQANHAKATLNFAIAVERANGRTLESIAKEVGMTKAGVRYVCRKMEAKP